MKILISKHICFRKRLLSLLGTLFATFSLIGCATNNSNDSVTKEMKDALNLYFSEAKTGKIEKESFYLNGALLFGMKAGDYKFRTLQYSFSDNSYFSLTYKDEFGYSEQKDIFRNKLLMRSPGYVGQVIKFPTETTMLDCTISFSYGGYIVSNTLKVELYGGSEATAAASGWTKIDATHYTYSYSSTLTDEINRPISKSTAAGSIDLNTMILNYNCKNDKYVNGIFSHTAYQYSYHYDASTGLIEVTDNTSSYNVKSNSIYLNSLYSNSKYQTDKENGWDWQKLNHAMGALKTFDKLLVENEKNSYTSIFYSGTYSYTYLFSL